MPPELDTEKSNVKNSQNTTLFLLSCFQYILSGVVLSTGPPFRKSMTENRTFQPGFMPLGTFLLIPTVPFVITIVAAVLFSMYMLLDPAKGLADFMDLTYLSIPFKLFIIVLGAGGFICAYGAERKVFVWLARMIGSAHDWIWPHRRKKRKEYKVMLEKMRV